MRIHAALTRAIDAPFLIEPVDLAPIGRQEILVKLVGTGICHTDLAIVHQHFPLPLPFVLGHEGAGVVVQVGADVTSHALDDRVVLSFESCGGCGACNSGHPAYCDHYAKLNYGRVREDGSPFFIDSQGTAIAGRYLGQSSFATHVIATPRNAIRVTDDVPLHLLCGMGCGFMTGASAVLGLEPFRSTDTFAIFGAGALGFAALFAARIRGYSRTIVVDRVASRLSLAQELGATEAIDTSRENLDERLAAMGGIDCCVDTTGFAPVVASAARALKRRGTIVLLGGSPNRVAEIDIVALLQGKAIRGEIFGDADPHRMIPQLIHLYRQGSFPIDRLIRTYSFEHINEAAADAVSGKTVKPVLLFGDNPLG
jgi:aryl-alcohol dehydrogenase